MLDGLGMAETTPGPLIMVTQFVGFMGAFRQATGLSPLLAGTLGGILTTWVTFVPCFLWIFLGAPFVERLRGNKALSAALATVTAAIVGVILNLAIWFALHSLFRQTGRIESGPLAFDVPLPESINLPALILTIAALIAMFRFKVGAMPVLASCALAGVGYWFFFQR
jgi:chromate transporter